MSDKPNETKTTDETPVVDPNIPPAAELIRWDVKDEVDSRVKAGEIRKRVVTDLADVEVSRRIKDLSTVLAKRRDLAKELGNIKPDNITYDENGKEQSSSWTKENAGKRKEAREKLAKIDKAIGKAINDADFNALAKWTGGGN